MPRLGRWHGARHGRDERGTKAQSFRRPRELLGEGFGFGNVFGAARWRQALEQRAAVTFGVHALVEQGDDSRVFAGTDESSKSLLQGDGRARHVVVREGV